MTPTSNVPAGMAPIHPITPILGAISPHATNTNDDKPPPMLKDRPSLLSLRVRTDRSGEWREGAYMKITAPIEKGQLLWRVFYADSNLVAPCFVVAGTDASLYGGGQQHQYEEALEAVSALIHGATLGIPDTSISLEIVCRGKPAPSNASPSSKVVAAWILRPDLEESAKERIIHRALKTLLTK